MNYFLAKTEPDTYSIDDLERDGKTVWDGVKSPQAIIFIKTARPGDLVLIYHSGGERAIRGVARVVSEPREDKLVQKAGARKMSSWIFDLEFVSKLKEPVTLKEIKETGKFEDFRLVYQSRLSTMTVPEKFVKWLKEVKAVQL
ncbi:MAG: EVE domain-containing protein [Candidatus Altimarinota bacterium]